jgi:hypothetical protein
MYFLQKNTEMAEEELVRIIEYKDIGKVSFIRRKFIRNLKITIRPVRGVQVSVPQFISFENAGRFVEEKRQWIRKSQLKLARLKSNISVFNENTAFHTRDYSLILKKHSKSTIRTVIGAGLITVIFPDYANVEDPRIQKAVRKAIIQTWRLEAAKYLPEVIKNLAIQHNLTYGRIAFRDNKTRWGSCSRENNISLNIHLMRLPDHLCKYVILHELAHTLYKHHQKAFWQYLDRLTGGRANDLDRELNRYSPEVW